MGLFDQFPYTNFHELNLDWLLKMMKELYNTVENFVALNTIKYADPIQWNITTQYEANTVVVDPQTGTAYISSKPVPAGVALTNTDYWSVIFTLDTISANKNLTLRDDGSNVLATFASNAGDWLLWNGTLYKVSQAISVNEAYVDGYNLTRYTIELFISDLSNAILTIIGDLDDLNTSDKTSIVNAINEVLTAIGDLDDLNTSDKTSIVNAINEVLTAIAAIDSIYNSVSDMISDTSISVDDYIQTAQYYSGSNIGGGIYHIKATGTANYDCLLLDNGLYAHLVSDKSNVFCYGVTENDDNSDNHTIVNYVLANNSKVIAPANFKVSGTIIINNIRREFEFVEITSDTDAPIIQVNQHTNTIKGLYLANSVGECIQIGGDNVVLDSLININRMYSPLGSCVVFGGTAGVLNSDLYMESCDYKEHGILFDLSNSYVGEIRIHNANFTDIAHSTDTTDNYAIFMDCSSHSMTGLMCDGLSFEASRGGIRIESTTTKFCEHLEIYHARCAEMSLTDGRKVLSFSAPDGASINGFADLDWIWIESLDFTSFNSQYRVDFEVRAAISLTQSTSYLGKIVNSVKLARAGFYIKEFNLEGWNGTAEQTTTTKISARELHIASGAGTVDVRLPYSASPKYCVDGIINVYLASGVTATSLRVFIGDETAPRCTATITAGSAYSVCIIPVVYQFGFYIKVVDQGAFAAQGQFSV